jgi:glycosyltransferase involved in cell wall biosynthesis
VEEKLEGRAIEALDIGTEDLHALYCNAAFLLFPSIEEGFGWPIVEAQACGCPVVTSNRPPMTEAAGEAAIFVDPTNPESAAAVIADGVSRREWLREAGLRNVQRFDSNRIADCYLALYEEILRDSDGH